MFETNWNIIFSFPKVLWLLNLLEWTHMTTCFYPHSLATFWSFGHVIIKVQNFLKGHSPKNANIFETNWNYYIFISKSFITIKLLEWTHMMTCYYPHNHATFRSFGHVTMKLQNFLKGHFQKIQILLKLTENSISSLRKVLWPATLLWWPVIMTSCIVIIVIMIFW